MYGNLLDARSRKTAMARIGATSISASHGRLPSATQVDDCRYNIRVNSLLPVAITNLKKRQRQRTLGIPQGACAALYLASDEVKFFCGGGLVVDGGLTAGKFFD